MSALTNLNAMHAAYDMDGAFLKAVQTLEYLVREHALYGVVDGTNMRHAANAVAIGRAEIERYRKERLSEFALLDCALAAADSARAVR